MYIVVVHIFWEFLKLFEVVKSEEKSDEFDGVYRPFSATIGQNENQFQATVGYCDSWNF